MALTSDRINIVLGIIIIIINAKQNIKAGEPALADTPTNKTFMCVNVVGTNQTAIQQKKIKRFAN